MRNVDSCQKQKISTVPGLVVVFFKRCEMFDRKGSRNKAKLSCSWPPAPLRLYAFGRRCRVHSCLPGKGAPGREPVGQVRDGSQQPDFSRIGAPDSFDAVVTWQGLAETYKMTGRLADAEALNRKVLALRAWNLGETHRQTLVSKLSLTQVLMSRGEFRKAERLARSTVVDLEREMGARHPDTLEASLTLANILKENGCLDEAEERQEQGWTTCKELLGSQHPRTVASLRDWAQCPVGARRFQESRREVPGGSGRV